MALELVHIERLFARKAPFEEIIAAIDAALVELGTRPDADRFRASLENDRVSAYCMYGRPVEECAAALDRYLAVDADPVLRGETIWVSCAEVPELRERYIPPMIAELERLPTTQRITALVARLREVRTRPIKPTSAS